MPSLFITFEGGEGTGKTTQIQRLKQNFEKQAIPVIASREPGGTPKAEKIRKMLLSGDIRHMGPYSEALMFFIARQDHVQNLIQPALDKGKVVLCDRFSDSTTIYQGVSNNIPAAELRKLEQTIVGNIQPTLTFILDLPEDIALKRVRKRAEESAQEEDRFETENRLFHQKLRKGFLDLAQQEKERCIVIDASATPDLIADRIWNHIEKRYQSLLQTAK